MFRLVLDVVVVACFFVFMIAWTFGMVYFRLKEHHRARSWKAALAGPAFSRVGIVAVVLVLRLSGVRQAGLWRHLEYWQAGIAVLGVLVAIAATGLLLWARWTLGAMWASVPLVKEEHRLVTWGPYGIVRHPIYTGLLGLAIGAALTFGFGPWLLAVVLVTAFALNRVRVEDGLMAGEFGAEHDAYRAKVPALIPRLAR